MTHLSQRQMILMHLHFIFILDGFISILGIFLRKKYIILLHAHTKGEIRTR